MNDDFGKKDQGQEKPSQSAHVYAPTHVSAGSLNLRPFRNSSAGQEPPQEEPDSGKSAARETAAEPDKPPKNAPFKVPDLFGDEEDDGEMEIVIISEEDGDEESEKSEESDGEILGEEADGETEDAGSAPEKGETVREAKRRERRLTEREKRRRARQRRILRALTAATFMVVFAAALLLAYFLLIIDEIKVYGCERFTEEQILEASGLHVGQHMWLVNLRSAKAAIEADPYVGSVEITRVYPDRLVLRVTEREEKAVILGMNTHAVIDKDGYVLSIGTRASYEGLLNVYGTGSGSYHVNQRLGEEADFHSHTLVTLLAALEKAELMDVVAMLDISNPLSITMTTVDGLTVQLGQAEYAEEKLENFRIVLPALIRNGYDKSGTLILSAKDSPVYSPPASQQTIPVEPIDPAEPTDPTDPADPAGTPDPADTPLPAGTDAPVATPVPEDAYSG